MTGWSNQKAYVSLTIYFPEFSSGAMSYHWGKIHKPYADNSYSNFTQSNYWLVAYLLKRFITIIFKANYKIVEYDYRWLLN